MSMSTPGGAPERIPSTIKIDKTTGAGMPPADEPTTDPSPATDKAATDKAATDKTATDKAAAGKAATDQAAADKSPNGARPAAKPATKTQAGKPAAKPGAGKTGGRPGATRPGASKGGKGRKPVTAVKMNGNRSWGPIAVVGLVVVLAGGIIGYGVYATSNGPKTWEDRAANIKGLVNYRKSDPNLVKGSQHQEGTIKYTINPPVAGPHNPRWQNCMGDVYDAPIANEHAVHSLEHGSVWITYQQGMPADQVAKLAKRVQGKEKMLMSPVAGLDSPVSLQAWGYQLKVPSVDDSRIDEFIRTLRVNASVEGPTAACDGGVTATGTTPQAATS